jgi:hypothetical protein
MPPPPVILPSCHAPPHAPILAPPLCPHRLVAASPLVASASASASLPQVVPETPPLPSAPTMTASDPHHSCLRWQLRRHCPRYRRRSAALTTMGPRPSSYATALMSADTSAGGLHFRPPRRLRPRPAQRRQRHGRHLSCLWRQSQHPCRCCHHHSRCHCCRSAASPTTAKKMMSWSLSFLLTLASAASLSSLSLSSLLSSL